MPIVFNRVAQCTDDLSAYRIQTVALGHDERQRHRLAVMLSSGQAAAIVLARDQCIGAGTVLLSDTGHALRIQAQPQALLRVSAACPDVLLRLVYHLANRHVRAMLAADAIYIEPDSVLAKMVEQLGGQVSPVELPFEPEPGAYHAGHRHGDERAHAHDTDMGRVGEMLSIAAHKAASQ